MWRSSRLTRHLHSHRHPLPPPNLGHRYPSHAMSQLLLHQWRSNALCNLSMEQVMHRWRGDPPVPPSIWSPRGVFTLQMLLVAAELSSTHCGRHTEPTLLHYIIFITAILCSVREHFVGYVYASKELRRSSVLISFVP